MAFWWASQGKNYSTAISQGSLWTCPWLDGRVPTDRALIKNIRPGDPIFHYHGPHLRAVSVAVITWENCPRPVGYPARSESDPDDGWLVRVEPIITDVAIHWHQLGELIPLGPPGPLDVNGRPQQKYLSAIDGATARKLLAAVDIELPGSGAATAESIEGAGSGAATDVVMIGTARVEQRALRAFLLGTRSEAPCGLCGRLLPAWILVAGHIKPRAECSPEERWNFAAVAMLVCALGCDALFERGYVTVDGEGRIQSGRDCRNVAVKDAVAALVGKHAEEAHNDSRAAAFEWHRTRHLDS